MPPWIEWLQGTRLLGILPWNPTECKAGTPLSLFRGEAKARRRSMTRCGPTGVTGRGTLTQGTEAEPVPTAWHPTCLAASELAGHLLERLLVNRDSF